MRFSFLFKLRCDFTQHNIYHFKMCKQFSGFQHFICCTTINTASGIFPSFPKKTPQQSEKFPLFLLIANTFPISMDLPILDKHYISYMAFCDWILGLIFSRFICVYYSKLQSFIVRLNTISTVQTYYILFVYSSVNGHLGISIFV